MKKIMCFGTFDNLHLGHKSYLKQAKKFGEYLIVVVARDKNVKKIKNRLPIENEKERLSNIKRFDFVDKAILGKLQDRLAIIKEYKPDIICLGYDQEADLGKIQKFFNGKIFRMKSYKKNIYKSSKLINF